MTKQHQFSVICQSVMGSQNDGYSIVYGMNGERFATRAEAIAHGFTMDRSDDFNIGVWESDRLVSLDWMDTPVDTDPDLLTQIQRDGETRI